MSKKPFDLAGFLGDVARLADQFGKAADKHRKAAGQNGKARSPEETVFGIIDAIAGRAFSRPFVSPHKGATAPGRSRARTSKSDSAEHDRTAYQSAERSRTGFSEMSYEIGQAITAATRSFALENKALTDELMAHRRMLERKRVLLLRDPAQMPILDPANADAYFRDVAARIDALPDMLALAHSEAKPVCIAIARQAAADWDPDFSEKWCRKVEALLTEDAARRGRYPADLHKKRGDLEKALIDFRAELAASDYVSPKAGFDPKRPLLSQFRMNMPLGTANLEAIRDMLDADCPKSHAAYASLTFKEVLGVAKDWQSGGMPVEAVDYVIALFERLVLFSALKEMGLSGASALKSTAEVKTEKRSAVDAHRGAELLNRLPDVLPLTTVEHTDRLIDAMVLASECNLPPLETRPMCKATDTITVPSAVGAAAEARREHYRHLIARLEASALASIGKKTGDRSQRSFRPWHLKLLRALRDAATLDTPSMALAAWDRHLANRGQVRCELLTKSSPFWRPLLEALLDRPGVAERDRDGDDRAALAQLQQIDEAAREIILKEARSILDHFDNTGFGMASRVDGMVSITAPFGSAQRRLLIELTKVLEMDHKERRAYFAPPPSAPDLGEFAQLIDQVARDGNYLRKGSIGPLLRARRFEQARGMIDSWIAVAPTSPLRDSLRAFDPQGLKITDWSVFERFLDKPTTAAIGLDFSGHVTCEITRAEDTVPFETARYSRDVFPSGEFGVELVKACASYPYPWQGNFEDIDVGLDVSGLAPLLIDLAAYRNERRGDWPKDLLTFHQTMVELAETFIFLHVNRLIARELAARTFSRAVPVIVGTHDFGLFDPVIHLAR